MYVMKLLFAAIDNSPKKILIVLGLSGFYYITPSIAKYLNMKFYDASILHIDIFYQYINTCVRYILQHPENYYFILEYLSFCYMALVIFSYINVAIAWNDQSYILGTTFMCILLLIGYILIPTKGPYFLENIKVIDLKQFPIISQTNFKLIDILSNQIDAFPSGHSASATFIMRWYWQKDHPLKYVILLFGLSIILSTIVLGQHYIVDVIAGCTVGIASMTYATYCTNTYLQSTRYVLNENMQNNNILNVV